MSRNFNKSTVFKYRHKRKRAKINFYFADKLYSSFVTAKLPNLMRTKSKSNRKLGKRIRRKNSEFQNFSLLL